MSSKAANSSFSSSSSQSIGPQGPQVSVVGGGGGGGGGGVGGVGGDKKTRMDANPFIFGSQNWKEILKLAQPSLAPLPPHHYSVSKNQSSMLLSSSSPKVGGRVTSATKTKTTTPLCMREDCKKPGDKHCSRCKTARYCSLDCQKNCWNVHKLFCKVSISSVLTSSAPISLFEKANKPNCGILAKGLLSHSFVLAHVTSFLDPNIYTKRSYPNSTTKLPLKDFAKLKLKNDIFNLFIASKAFNDTMRINEPIWHLALKSMGAPGIQIAAPCGVLVDKTFLYHAVRTEIRDLLSTSDYEGKLSWLDLHKSGLHSISTTYSGFLAFVSSLSHLLLGYKYISKHSKNTWPVGFLSSTGSRSLHKNNDPKLVISRTCTFCNSLDSLEGNILTLLEETFENLQRDIFPTFDKIPTHCFFLACKICSFRIDINVNSKLTVCETYWHQHIVEEVGDFDDEELDIIPLKSYLQTRV